MKEHYNLYYIFLWEREEFVPCERAKNEARKKVLKKFKKFKTKRDPACS